ncbi:cupin domain-containing protein [Enterovibrio coralii]|uniref:Anti-sigma factor n=1 Tax=Enterovibrio coralii TaxID=294935 RepID=A0A135IBR4_9GAMM|nr:cupin domain-containing protein [Enterovibrio coralii]KXF82906.1 anti-sigma factor [Enterovibrio coralii]
MSSSKLVNQTYLELNIDLTQAVQIQGGDVLFSPTPMAGVERMMFERCGDEVVKRATSCVRYAPESYFKSHSHPGGEEFIVLSGTFSDQNGDFSEGWYVRNPVGSSHRPFTDEGCEIFVKLSQLPPEEEATFALNTNEQLWMPVSQHESRLILWQSSKEETSLHQYKAGFERQEAEEDALNEFFIISGTLTVNGQGYPTRSWLRFPPHTPLAISTDEGAKVYRKKGAGQVRC